MPIDDLNKIPISEEDTTDNAGTESAGSSEETPAKKKKEKLYKQAKYSDIIPTTISKAKNLNSTDLESIHKEIVPDCKFPGIVKDIQNSAVTLGTNDPGKYYLQLSCTTGLNRRTADQIKTAAKKYIGKYFSMSPSKIDSSIKNDDIKLFRKPKSNMYYIKYTITEAELPAQSLIDSLIENVRINNLAEADRALQTIIEDKIQAKFNNIIK